MTADKHGFSLTQLTSEKIERVKRDPRFKKVRFSSQSIYILSSIVFIIIILASLFLYLHDFFYI